MIIYYIGQVEWKWSGSGVEVEWKWSGSGLEVDWISKHPVLGQFSFSLQMDNVRIVGPHSNVDYVIALDMCPTERGRTQ